MYFWYKRNAHLFLLLCGISYLTACANIMPTLKANERISNNEGILAIVSHSPFNNVVYEFRTINGDGAWRNESEPFQAGVELRLLKLPQGRYFLHRVVVGTSSIQFDKTKAEFDIKQGQISYFGDIFLSQSQPGWLSIQWLDKQEQLESYLAEKYPFIFSEYPVEFVKLN